MIKTELIRKMFFVGCFFLLINGFLDGVAVSCDLVEIRVIDLRSQFVYCCGKDAVNFVFLLEMIGGFECEFGCRF